MSSEKNRDTNSLDIDVLARMLDHTDELPEDSPTDAANWIASFITADPDVDNNSNVISEAMTQAGAHLTMGKGNKYDEYKQDDTEFNDKTKKAHKQKKKPGESDENPLDPGDGLPDAKNKKASGSHEYLSKDGVDLKKKDAPGTATKPKYNAVESEDVDLIVGGLVDDAKDNDELVEMQGRYDTPRDTPHGNPRGNPHWGLQGRRPGSPVSDGSRDAPPPAPDLDPEFGLETRLRQPDPNMAPDHDNEWGDFCHGSGQPHDSTERGGARVCAVCGQDPSTGMMR